MKRRIVYIPFLCLMILPMTGCCNNVTSPQKVDVSPLQELTVPANISKITDIVPRDIFDNSDNLDTYMVGRWDGDGQHPDFFGITVYFWLIPENLNTNDKFLDKCTIYWDNAKKFIFGGDQDNQYCISTVLKEKYSPDAFCTPTGEYFSFVVFQKGRLLITIEEWSHDKNSTVKNDVIKLLAQELTK